MYLHPNDYLWMAEQDRDRAMAQRALERAARSGGNDQPGAVRGGLTSLAAILRRAAAATTPDPARRVEPDRSTGRTGRLNWKFPKALSALRGSGQGLSSAAWLGASPARSSSVALGSCPYSSERPTPRFPAVPRWSLVGGEAGVGKTRLVAEVANRLRDDGWLVLEGGTVALGDDGLPFGPIVEALRALVRNVDPGRIADAAGPALPELARLVPELSNVGPDASTPTSQADWLQVHIFEGMLRLLGRLGDDTPVLLVIEDLQWADRSTRDLLAFLSRNARGERLLIVGTYRTDDLHRRHPLSGWLAEAERRPNVERVAAGSFRAAGARRAPGGHRGRLAEPGARGVDCAPLGRQRVLRGRADRQRRGQGRRPRPAARHAPRRPARAPVCPVGGSRPSRRSGGRGRPGSRARAPRRSLRTVRGRAGSGAAGGRRSPAARSSTSPAMSSATGSDTPSCRRRPMTSCCRRNGGRSMPPTRGRPRHDRPRAASPQRAGSSSSPTIGRPPTIPRAPCARRSPRVTHRGRSTRSPTRRGQFERAIELWDAVGTDDHPEGRDLAELYDSACAAAILAADGARAVALARKAIELIDAADDAPADRERRARARERLGMACSLAGESVKAIQLLEEAVELFEGSPASTDQARVLAGLAANLMLAGRSSESTSIRPAGHRPGASRRRPGHRGARARGARHQPGSARRHRRGHRAAP